MKNTIKVFIYGALVCFGSSSLAQSYKEYKRDHLFFDANMNYFNSTQNYASSGAVSSLGRDQYFTLTNLNFSLRYMPKKTWSVFAGTQVGNAESQNSVAKRTNSSLTNAYAGFDWVMYNEGVQIIPEFSYLMPLTKVDQNYDGVVNAEGVNEMLGRVVVQGILGKTLAYAWIGANYRGDGRSFLLPYGVGFTTYGGGWNLAAEIIGSQSISDDKDKDNTLNRESYLQNVNGGSYRFYSINPSLIDSTVYITYKLNRSFRLRGFGGMTLTGSNAAAGYHAGVGMTYLFDFGEGYSELSPEERDMLDNGGFKSDMYKDRQQIKVDPISSDKDVKKFKEDTGDGVDQSIFKATPTPKPVPSPTIYRINNSPNQVRDVDPIDLQNQLDNAEMEVELRKKKKKKK